MTEPTTYRIVDYAAGVVSVPAETSADPGAIAVPFDGVIASVSYQPQASVHVLEAGGRTFRLMHGDVEIAALEVGMDRQFADYEQLPLSLSEENLQVKKGDLLCWESSPVGVGMTDPGGMVRVTFRSEKA